ncbi:MAG: hypothetical protein AAB651_00365 [Patescibacteria group bacterium]
MGKSNFSRAGNPNFLFEKKLEDLHKMGRINNSELSYEPSQAQLWIFALTGIRFWEEMPLWGKKELKKLMTNMRSPVAESYTCNVCKTKFSFRRPPTLCPVCNAIDSFIIAEPLASVSEEKKEMKMKVA